MKFTTIQLKTLVGVNHECQNSKNYKKKLRFIRPLSTLQEQAEQWALRSQSSGVKLAPQVVDLLETALQSSVQRKRVSNLLLEELITRPAQWLFWL